MTIAWIMYVLLVGGLLALGAGCLEQALRAARLPARGMWAIAMLGTLGFAIYALRTAVAPEATAALVQMKVTKLASAPTESAHGVLASLEALRFTVSNTIALGIGAASVRVPANLAGVVLALWAAGSAVLLFVHLMVNGRVVRQRHAWPVVELPGGTARVAPALGPAVIGLTSPEIVVPSWLLAKSTDEQRLVMVHEQEHIAARDQYLPFGALLVATLLPWHPAVWWSLARLRLAVELDCDARVLRRGERANAYGMLLIDIAAQCGGHRVGALALADRTSHLERRILAMTPRASRFTRARSIGLAAVSALAIVTACEARLPTSSEVQSMDVASAEKAMVEFKVISDQVAGNVVYEVDGEKVSAEKAHAIPANRIATVNVVKSSAKDGSKQTIINIATLDAPVQERLALLSDTAGPRMKVALDRGVAPPLPPQGALMSRSKEPFAGLLFVDGVRAPEDALSRIKPDDIASVDVIKGVAARAISSDPAAANGIIKVTTKAAAKRSAEAAAKPAQ